MNTLSGFNNSYTFLKKNGYYYSVIESDKIEPYNNDSSLKGRSIPAHLRKWQRQALKMNRSGKMNLQVKTSKISAYGISDKGQKRQNNEDSIFIDDQGRYLLVADGMGGQLNGAQASSLVIDFVNRQLMPQIIKRELADITQSGGAPPEISGLCSVIETAVQQANQELYKTNRKENKIESYFMGTTLAGLYLSHSGYMIYFHIGDSRGYRLRNKDLTLLGRDHSVHQEWIDGGRKGHEPPKNILTRAIGFSEYVQIDISYSRYTKNDIYLLCSDGLTNMLPEQRIKSVLNDCSHIIDAADSLINESNAAGGTDNISVVLCQIEKT